MNLRTAARLLEIQRVLVRHRLDDFVRATHLYRPLRFFYYFSPWTWFQRRRGETRAESLRLALEELGPIFVKFGQALSTRRDLLPPDIADELAKLQDQVPPFPGAAARAGLESSYGRPLAELYARFDDAPLAAASIAQVHVAQRLDGREVVVKVLRPGVRAQIGRDLEVLELLAALAERWWPEARRLRPIEVVRDYRQTILDELDLMREAANASQLKRNFAGSALLYVPEVHWDLSRTDVMVMERIRGVPIGDIAALRARGTDFRRLAENGVEIFFTQVFRHNFFHADMHPGNIFVIVDDPQAPRYAAVDFGIVGTLAARDQRFLAEIFLAVFDRDYRRVADLHLQAGWVPPGTRVEALESVVRTICEPIFDRPLREISFGTVLLRLFAALQRFDGHIQPQLILLQKTLLNIEGLGRQLYPELDIWKTAAPVLRQWRRDRIGPRALFAELRRGLPAVLDVAKALPELARVAIERAEERARRAPPGAPDAGDTGAAAEFVQAGASADGAPVAVTLAALAPDNDRRDLLITSAALIPGGVLWLGLPLDPTWPGALLVAGGILLAAAGWLHRRR